MKILNVNKKNDWNRFWSKIDFGFSCFSGNIKITKKRDIQIMTLNTRKGDKFCLKVDDDDDNEMNKKFKDVVEVRTQPF